MIDTHNSFSFQYGKIEIRAKLPLGDWLYPALWLKPKYDSYGPFYSSGRIVLAMARGNANLECDGKDLSSRTLEAGIMAGVRETMAKKMVELKLNEGWHTQFHNFSFTWTSESLSFSVDGGQENYLLKKGENIKDVINFDNPRVQWKSATPIAPFDKEFYISLGLFAGGMTDFPDSCKSGGQPKPWRNKAVKALANFWQAKEQWFGTWNNEDSALQIDYIKVIAL
ncbi:hypothetical protein AAG570_002531 [Ranatra chinensis]|uniref:GH16 domain-containing protein n=1 Tax=Ranatra chinensis TaxID=642074 RepID=A0ABD0Y7U0_9HEMI